MSDLHLSNNIIVHPDCYIVLLTISTFAELLGFFFYQLSLIQGLLLEMSVKLVVLVLFLGSCYSFSFFWIIVFYTVYLHCILIYLNLSGLASTGNPQLLRSV